MRLSLHAKIKARKHTMLASPFFLYGTETAEAARPSPFSHTWESPTRHVPSTFPTRGKTSRSTPSRQMENALSRTVLLNDSG